MAETFKYASEPNISDPAVDPITYVDRPQFPDPLASEALYGLAGDIVRAFGPHTEADPVAILVQTLVTFGNVIGREAHWFAESTRHALALFAVLVGMTAKARKGTSWNLVRRLFAAVDPTWSNDHVEFGLSSGEGLAYRVRDDQGEDTGVADKRLLVIEEEFASVLKVMAREGNILSTVLRRAFDSGELRTLTKQRPVIATGAHISIVGHVTAGELRRYLTETEMGNGFANRFMYFCVRRSKTLPEGNPIPDEKVQPLVDRLRSAVEFGRSAGQMGRDPSARKIWNEVYPELSEGTVGLFGAVTARGEALVMRMAAIYALLDCSPLIRPEHLTAALAVWESSLQSARFIFSSAVGDPTADAILAALRRSPTNALERTQIRDLFGRNRKSAEIERALGVLLEQGLVRRGSRSTDGRDAEVWALAGTT